MAYLLPVTHTATRLRAGADPIIHDTPFKAPSRHRQGRAPDGPRRIERLKKAGDIIRQVTLLDHEKLGLTFEVFATVKLQMPTREDLDKFETAIADWPEVVECATVTGALR